MNYKKPTHYYQESSELYSSFSIPEKKENEFLAFNDDIEISPIKKTRNSPQSLKNISYPLKDILNQEAKSIKQHLFFEKEAQNYQYNNRKINNQCFKPAYQQLYQKFMEMKVKAEFLQEENKKLRNQSSQNRKLQQKRAEYQTQIRQKDHRIIQLSYENTSLKARVTEMQDYIEGNRKNHQNSMQGWSGNVRSCSNLLQNNHNNSNQFYIQQLQRSNEQLKRENRRYSQLILKKLKHSIIS